MSTAPPAAVPPKSRAFRRAVYRGLSLVAPPLATIAVLLWVFATIQQFLLAPMTQAARAGLMWKLPDVRHNLTDLDPTTAEIETPDGPFVRVGRNDFVPEHIAHAVSQQGGPLPSSGRQMYERYIDLYWLRPAITIPLFALLFVLALYLLGKFLAIGVGRFLMDSFDLALGRLPLVRSLYPSIKRLTGMLLSDPEHGYARIVAVEFPSPGTWAIAFVTGESLPQIGAAVGEPVVSLHVPYPPLLKGSIITVAKSKTIELDMTVDQAIQYVVSCGVFRSPQLTNKE